MARQSSISPVVRAAAASAVRPLPGWGGAGHARLIRDWIGARTYFLADPLYDEALHDPSAVLREILTRGNVGLDCDDVALLAAAMGLSIGLKARFVMVAFTSPNAPYRHIWAELAGVDSRQWVAVDPTRLAQPFAHAAITRRQIVEV